MNSKQTNKPVVRWRGDRWVNDGLDLLPCQVHVYGGLSKAATHKRDWLRDMCDQLLGNSKTPGLGSKQAANMQQQAFDLHHLSKRYHDWAEDLHKQGL